MSYVFGGLYYEISNEKRGGSLPVLYSLGGRVIGQLHLSWSVTWYVFTRNTISSISDQIFLRHQGYFTQSCGARRPMPCLARLDPCGLGLPWRLGPCIALWVSGVIPPQSPYILKFLKYLDTLYFKMERILNNTYKLHCIFNKQVGTISSYNPKQWVNLLNNGETSA